MRFATLTLDLYYVSIFPAHMRPATNSYYLWFLPNLIIATITYSTPTQINRWKQQAMVAVKSSFTGKQQKLEQNDQQLMDKLYQQIGQLKCENDFLKKVCGNEYAT